MQLSTSGEGPRGPVPVIEVVDNCQTAHPQSAIGNPQPAAPRITLIGPVFPHRGGIAHYTACLARALSETNCQVQVISFRKLYPKWLFPGRSEFDPSVEGREAGGAEPQATAHLRFPSESLLTPLNPLRWIAALRAIGRFAPDLVVMAWWHSWFFPCTAFCLSWLRWIQRRRTVLLCHNVGSHDHRLADGVAWPVLSRLPTIHIVHASDHPARIRARNPRARVVCVLHPTYDVFARSTITREEARRRLGFGPDDEVCLMFGLVRRYKGLDTAIEAMALLGDRPRLRLVVAGEFYEPRQPYEEMVRRLGVSERIVLHDRYIPNEEVALHFSAADLLVAPYRTASHSGSVQIARAFGLPVVASDTAGLQDLVADGQTGLLAPPEDPKALAGAIARFFGEKLAGRFRGNLEKQDERYSWKTLAETIRGMAVE